MTDKKLAVNEKNIRFDTAKSTTQRVDEGRFVHIVVVGVGVDQRPGGGRFGIPSGSHCSLLPHRPKRAEKNKENQPSAISAHESHTAIQLLALFSKGRDQRSLKYHRLSQAIGSSVSVVTIDLDNDLLGAYTHLQKTPF